jgi:hypothetical protein
MSAGVRPHGRESRESRERRESEGRTSTAVPLYGSRYTLLRGCVMVRLIIV